jgi:small GTP-binding protein
VVELHVGLNMTQVKAGTMITQKFEIKVALLGYVSVGKTTVLNAMFRDKFSEVSMRRTTAGINFFRVVNPEVPKNNVEGDPSLTHHEQWSVVADEETQKPVDVLKEIEASNRELREARRIEEKWFNIELEEPLCEMRQDTSLVIVDVPGMNEADSESLYSKYVEDNWKSFDCVVIVMDARQGVNTEEQVGLLELVKRNLTTKKDIPVIILFNKVDEPDDPQQAMLLEEAGEKISKVFSVSSRDTALRQVLEAIERTSKLPDDAFPVLLSTSAIHAFFYRAASLLSYQHFKEKFDADLIDMIGREEVGRFRWKKLNAEEKYKAVYESVRADADYTERLEATNFDKFLSILAVAVGGKERQKELLQKQIDVALESLMTNKDFSVTLLRSIYDKSVVLGRDLRPLKTKFWSMYYRCQEQAMRALTDRLEVARLGEVANLLWTYFTFTRSLDWKEQEKVLRFETCKLLKKQIGVLIGVFVKHETATRKNFQLCHSCYKVKIHEVNSEGAVNPYLAALPLWNQIAILESILLLSFNETFCETFGREKIFLSQLKCSLALDDSSCNCTLCCPSNPQICDCGGAYVECADRSGRGRGRGLSKWQPSLDGDGTIEVNPNIAVPESLSDKRHWGHVAWKCCKILQAMDKRK